MTNRKYFTERKEEGRIELVDLDNRFEDFYNFFKEKDYFKEKAYIKSGSKEPNSIKSKCGILIGISPFPLEERQGPLNANHIFDLIEFFYDHVSKPEEWGYFTDDTGYNYQGECKIFFVNNDLKDSTTYLVKGG